MQVNVAQLLKSAVGAERTFKVDESIEIEGQEIDILGDVKLIRTNRSILVKGDLETEIDIECSRCLEIFAHPMHIMFEEEYFPQIDVVSGLPVSMPDEDPGYFTINTGHVIDLDDAIREYALLSLPMKPLCKQECAGLCPICGQNLNTGSCNCHIDDI